MGRILPPSKSSRRQIAQLIRNLGLSGALAKRIERHLLRQRQMRRAGRLRVRKAWIGKFKRTPARRAQLASLVKWARGIRNQYSIKLPKGTEKAVWTDLMRITELPSRQFHPAFQLLRKKWGPRLRGKVLFVGTSTSNLDERILRARQDRYRLYSDLITELALGWSLAQHGHSLRLMEDSCSWCGVERRFMRAKKQHFAHRSKPAWWRYLIRSRKDAVRAVLESRKA